MMLNRIVFFAIIKLVAFYNVAYGCDFFLNYNSKYSFFKNEKTTINDICGYVYQFHSFYGIFVDDHFIGEIKTHKGFIYKKDSVIHLVPYIKNYTVMDYSLFDLKLKVKEKKQINFVKDDSIIPYWRNVTIVLEDKKYFNNDVFFKYKITGITRSETDAVIVFGLKTGPIGMYYSYRSENDNAESIHSMIVGCGTYW